MLINYHLLVPMGAYATAWVCLVPTVAHIVYSPWVLIIQVRAFNEHNISGNWSQPLLVPLDEECSVASINDSFISIFYGQTGREKIKILEIACGSHTPSDSGSIEGKIQSIDKK